MSQGTDQESGQDSSLSPGQISRNPMMLFTSLSSPNGYLFTKTGSNGPQRPGGCRPTNHSTVFDYRNGSSH
ncbi:unnamed protein product [Sphenostylis stenocarpa]|uniref:Uncharacterized protein n=1 Tax=Sphenostylis stenocarpa TaxID=92480 RepID=A0AA86TBF4_9FABA|nr:unnamed protein product [Sphenostylis stenocarpa]